MNGGHLTTLHGAPVSGLGYRQKTILGTLVDAGRPVPTGYLIRVCGCDPRTVHMALLGLAGRGLVLHTAWGKWAAA